MAETEDGYRGNSDCIQAQAFISANYNYYIMLQNMSSCGINFAEMPGFDLPKALY